MTTLKLALDWTPNVNHIGIFVAKEMGFYAQQNLQIDVLNPLTDNYALTPGKKLELGEADFAIAPFETVISLNNKPNKVDAVALYAILQEDMSSIASLQTSHLHRPKLLDGKTYASYKARYEDHIVKEMVKNDGGQGDLALIYPDKLGIWNTLLEGSADATWIFDNWEGVEAEERGVALHTFKLSQFGIPYGYSPVILSTQSNLASQKEEYATMIQATQKGYLYAAANKAEAAQILTPHLTPGDQQHIDIGKALQMTAPYFGDDATCGRMDPKRVELFVSWLIEHQLENAGIREQTLFSNELL